MPMAFICELPYCVKLSSLIYCDTWPLSAVLCTPIAQAWWVSLQVQRQHPWTPPLPDFPQSRLQTNVNKAACLLSACPAPWSQCHCHFMRMRLLAWIRRASAVQRRARLDLVGQTVMQAVQGCPVTGLLGWEVFGSCLARFGSKYPLTSVSSYASCI